MFSPLLQKGLAEATNSNVNTSTSVKISTTTTKISVSRNNEPSRNFKNVSRVGLKVDIEYLNFCVMALEVCSSLFMLLLTILLLDSQLRSQ